LAFTASITARSVWYGESLRTVKRNGNWEIVEIISKLSAGSNGRVL